MTSSSRREFLSASMSALPMLLLGQELRAAESEMSPRPFKLNYAPHAGLFEHSAGPAIVDQIHYAADLGFAAWEDNSFGKREKSEQLAISGALQERGMQMGVFVGSSIDWRQATLTRGDSAIVDGFLAEIRASVEVAKRAHARWMTIVPGHVNLSLDLGWQTANVSEALKRACEILEPHELVMVLEPLNPRNHPGMFLRETPQAYALCKSVNSPSCKILFDIYHQQISEGNLIPNIDSAWDEIAYFQVGDTPGRKEPTTGEINYRNVFAHIHRKGYRGVVGMEHGKSITGVAGETALVDAYRYCDDF